MNPDRACPHENNAATVEVILLEDTGKRQAQIRLWCADCEEPYLWPESVPIGVDLSGVARSVDRRELRVAVRNTAELPFGDAP